MDLEYLKNLIYLTVAHEQGFLLDQLMEDAADGPCIDAQSILLLTQEHFGSSVPNEIMGLRFLSYHSVSISWVNVRIGMLKARAKPKSAILMRFLLSIKIFCGFKSL